MNGRLRSLLGVVSVGALAVLGLACGSAPTEGDDAVSSSTEEGLKKRVVTDGTIPGADGKPVRYRTYQSTGKEKAIVVFLNGRGEYIEKYDVLFSADHEYPAGPAADGETLASMPVTFVALDHEGQGASTTGRIPGHVDSFEFFVKDVEKLFATVPQLASHKVPIFLVSHSMGGLIAARFAQTNKGKIDGLVLSSPMLAHRAPAPLTSDLLMQIAGFYAAPAPYGMGMGGLCTEPKLPDGTKIDATMLAAIAGIHTNDTLKACFYDPSGAICPALTQCLLYGYDNDCGMPAIDFARLNALFQYLKALAQYAPGCRQDDITAPSFDPCPDPVLTTDEAYCDYYYHSPKRAPAATFGWLFSSFMSQGAYAQTPGTLGIPVLLMTNGNDGVVDSTAHVCAGPIAGDCRVETFPGFGHELLSSAGRAAPIEEIREFINSHINK